MRSRNLLLPVILLLAVGCASTPQGRSETDPVAERGPDIQVLRGEASYYHDSLHGNPTASGEPYDRAGLTAAHRTLPFGTRVRVRNLANGRTVVVRINDRGPFVEGRIVDLSRRAAEDLGMVQAGVIPVQVEILPDAAR